MHSPHFMHPNLLLVLIIIFIPALPQNVWAVAGCPEQLTLGGACSYQQRLQLIVMRLCIAIVLYGHYPPFLLGQEVRVV